MIDFSILKDIDFSNKDNLLFFSIFSVITIIVFLIFVVIAVEIINLIGKAVIKLFFKKHEPEQKMGAGVNGAPGQKTAGTAAGITGPGNFVNNSSEEIKIPTPGKKVASGFIGSLGAGKEKPGEKQKNAAEFFEEKEKKGILEHLNKLKTDKDEGRETLASKMPSRQPAEKDNIYEKIEIPTSKRFDYSKKTEEDAVTISSELHDKTLTYDKEKTSQIQDKKSAESAPGRKEDKAKTPVAGKKDDSIFGGQEEVSRIKLRQKLRYDPKIWQAQKDLRMDLSPAERVKLEKEVFAPVYGGNISKADLKLGIKKLSQKMLSAKDPQEHAKIRKEIEFFKKIGGIK